MKQTFEAWHSEDDSGTEATLSTPEGIERLRVRGQLGQNPQLLWRIEADTWEEAMAIHSLRLGCGPYIPQGEAAPCPRCRAWYYPKGSAQCWRCGATPPVKKQGPERRSTAKKRTVSRKPVRGRRKSAG
jgi:hypothetical protein